MVESPNTYSKPTNIAGLKKKYPKRSSRMPKSGKVMPKKVETVPHGTQSPNKEIIRKNRDHVEIKTHGGE